MSENDDEIKSFESWVEKKKEEMKDYADKHLTDCKEAYLQGYYDALDDMVNSVYYTRNNNPIQPTRNDHIHIQVDANTKAIQEILDVLKQMSDTHDSLNTRIAINRAKLDITEEKIEKLKK